MFQSDKSITYFNFKGEMQNIESYLYK